MSITFSVIINTFNRASTLRNAILGVSQLRHKSYELIVVDGPSTDETGQILDEMADRLTHVRIEQRNLSMSRNAGVRLARGKYVAFIDDDSVPEPDWLDALETCFNRPEVAIAGGFIRDHTGVAYQCRFTCCDPFGDAQQFDSRMRALEFLERHPRWFLTATGTNVAYRKSALLEIGLFDETFEYFLEETDVILRLLNKGYAIEIAETGDVHHKFAPSHLRDIERRPTDIFVPARSKAYFAIKHAQSRIGSRAAFEYLLDYQRQQANHLLAYLARSIIDADEHGAQLRRLRAGISEGVRAAYARSSAIASSNGSSVETGRCGANLGKQSAPIRVVFLSQQYDQLGAGGIAAWTRIVCEGLVKRGVEVSVITRTDTHPRIDFIEGVWVHRVKTRHQPSRTLPPLGKLPQTIKDHAYSVLDELLQIKLTRGVDVVSHPIWDLEGVAVHRSKMFACVLTLHTTYALSLNSHAEWMENRGYFDGHVSPIIEGEKMLLTEASFICANSRAIVSDIEETYGVAMDQRSTFIPHGLPALAPSAAAKEKRDMPVAVFMGRFEHRKGFDVVLQAAKILFEAGTRFRLQLIGGTSGSDIWMDFAQQNRGAHWLDMIEIRGVVTEAEKLRLLRDADLFIAPSRYESFGLIFLEAMRLGLPCIGTDVGGIPEVVDDQCGLLVPPESAADLARAIGTLVSDAELRKRMSRAARDRFREHFTDVRMIEKLLALYGDVHRSSQARTASSSAAIEDENQGMVLTGK